MGVNCVYKEFYPHYADIQKIIYRHYILNMHSSACMPKLWATDKISSVSCWIFIGNRLHNCCI